MIFYVVHVNASLQFEREVALRFEYQHKNPYHDHLAQFSFVFRDEETEEHQGLWNLAFQRKAPLHVEIGSGYGHFLKAFSKDHPEFNIMGIDFRFKRSFQVVRDFNQNQNVRFLRANAQRVPYIFAEGEVDSFYIFFSDPWPKRRQHKKRLITQEYLVHLHKLLKVGGKIYVKTDHDQYFGKMVEAVEKLKNLFQVSFLTYDLHNDSLETLLSNYTTKFEKIFVDQNVKIKGFILEK